MISEILGLYINEWVNIWNYENPCVESIGFAIIDLKSLLSLLNKEGVLIKSMELFDKNTLNFIPPDFWYDKSDFNENRKHLDSFLKSLLNLNEFYFALSIWNQKIAEELNKTIKIKYSKS